MSAGVFCTASAEQSDNRKRTMLLRARRERPRSRTAEQRDEIAPM